LRAQLLSHLQDDSLDLFFCVFSATAFYHHLASAVAQVSWCGWRCLLRGPTESPLSYPSHSAHDGASQSSRLGHKPIHYSSQRPINRRTDAGDDSENRVSDAAEANQASEK